MTGRRPAAVAVLALALLATAIGAQEALELLPVQGQVSLIAGGGGNVAVLDGPEGVLLVDTGGADTADALLRALRTVTPRPIHFILNTNADADHVGGNAVFARAGRPAPGYPQGTNRTAPIYAHENVLTRMASPQGTTPAYDGVSWPTVTFFTQKRTLHFNGEPIELHWQKGAHSDGDVMVFFRRSDVIAAGDVLNSDSFPVIDLARGGSIDGVIDGLNHLIDLTIPRLNQMEGTRVIPGHGRLANEAEVVEYRDMATIVRDRVAALAGQGKSLAEVQSAHPAYEYEPLYGVTRTWTTEMFVEAVYRSLRAPQAR